MTVSSIGESVTIGMSRVTRLQTCISLDFHTLCHLYDSMPLYLYHGSCKGVGSPLPSTVPAVPMSL